METLELLDVRDVAKRLKLSPRQIWKLTSTGRLPKPLRIGRSVRWRAADLARFLEAGADMERFTADTAEAGK